MTPNPSISFFESFLAPIFQHFLIDQKALQQLYQSLDWAAESERLRCPNLRYPDYYSTQNFHGVKGGYLSVDAAVTYDPVTQYVLPPNETLVRQGLIDQIESKPRRILDLGCGTGSTTVLLKQTFPQAEVIGLDLSPYMLVMAEHKALKAHLVIEFVHGNAEHTMFPDASFDLVTASLLFHETPPEVTRAILRESYRLLTVGGEILVLDGNQQTLRNLPWLTEIFEEPYIRAYAASSLEAGLGWAGFGTVQTQDLWWVHQVTRGVKPLPGQKVDLTLNANLDIAGNGQWVMG
ncbi:MAG: methyltransferase domain-containing protein [Cyanothece sp. SIO1E1]|nr:methyltransferase domain-containing protein [Cyanothece sp. SIO1E1]